MKNKFATKALCQMLTLVIILVSIQASAGVAFKALTGGTRLFVVGLAYGSALAQSMQANRYYDTRRDVWVNSALATVVILILMDDQTAMPQIAPVTEATAKTLGLTAEEAQSVNANLSVINAVISSSIQDSEQKGLSPEDSQAALSEALSDNLDAATTSAVRKVRAQIAKDAQ